MERAAESGGPNGGQTEGTCHQGRTPPPLGVGEGAKEAPIKSNLSRDRAGPEPPFCQRAVNTSPGPGQGPPPRVEHCAKQSLGSFSLGLTHAGLVGDQGFAATGLKLVGEVRQVGSRPIQNQDELGEGAWKAEGKEG